MREIITDSFKKKLFKVFFMVLLTISSSSLLAQITFDEQKQPIKEILKKIEENSPYRFFYNEGLKGLDNVISLKVQNVSIEQTMTQLLANTNIHYRIENNNLIALFIKGNTVKINEKKRVSGYVTDQAGEPVVGATIRVENSNHGTISNVDGQFQLEVPKQGNLIISYIGYVTRIIHISDRDVYNIVLLEDSKILDEVVVTIGYGTIRRKDLTGSVSSVNTQDLKDIPVNSAALAIVGKMPGVQVTQTEGSPDAEVKIRVRGGGSITQDNSPLYIVDGFPVDGISDISPVDIESVVVLKDASSTAIYGSRGANGVIMITTKSGVEGRAKISYNMYCGVREVTKILDVMNPYEYVFWQYEVQNASSSLTKYFGDFRDFPLYEEMSGTNWQNEIFGRKGMVLYNNLSISGGTKTAKYSISFTNSKEESIMIGSGINRTNLNVKTSYDARNWLKIDLTTRFSATNLNGAGTGQQSGGETNSRLPHIIQYRPVKGLSEFVDNSLVDEDDFETSSAYLFNPLDQTNDDYRRVETLALNINGGFEFRITKDLKYRLDVGAGVTDVETNRFYGIKTSNVRNYGEKPMADKKYDKIDSYRMANVITYSKRDFLPKNNIVLMLGEELNYRKLERTSVSVKYFPKYIDVETALSMMNLGLSDPIISLNDAPDKMSSFFGRLNYDYNRRYLFSATFRADGSSKFARGNRWGYFPSGAFAWRVSDEDFMKETSRWLANLKARVSYGASGNNRIANDAWKKTFSTASDMYMEGNEEVPTTYIIQEGDLSNPRLKWETTVTRNLGVDFGFFNQRLSGTIDLYNNTTKDLLIRMSIPSSTGYTRQYRNVGQTSNRGVEVSIEGIIVDKNDFKLSASFNIAFNKNRIEKLGDATQWEESSAWSTSGGPSGDYLVKEGAQIGLMYGYVTDGMYSFDDFNYTNGVYTLKEGVADNRELIAAQRFWPGVLKYVNQDNDPKITGADKVVIGNANPKHTGGFNFTSRYKNIDLSVFFNWVYGNDIYNANKLNFNSFQSARTYKNLLNEMNSENRFTYYNKTTGLLMSDPAELQIANANATMWSPINTQSQLHSWAVEDGSFLRLNNFSIGYSIPKDILSKLKLEQLRIYFTGNNLWTWTNYSGYDPEVDTRRSVPTTPGVDWCAYPRSRSYNVGLNLIF